MHVEVSVSLGTLFGFLLVLARVSGALVFLPMPGIKSGPETARIVLALGLTMALFPKWPVVKVADPSTGQVVAWLLAEAGLGLLAGVVVALTLEGFAVAAQIAGLQAGYSFASTMDPTTQADSGILLVFAQLVGGLLFFALGLHREVMRVFIRSLDSIPPGSFGATRSMAEQVIRMGGEMLVTGLRLALPVVALLLLIDIALALLGRVNAQLQLITLAFPIKILAALLVLAWISTLFPSVVRGLGGRMLVVLEGVLRS